MKLIREWAKPLLILTVFLVIAWLLPSGPFDPWGLFSIKKAAYMVFALAFIQALGAAMIRFLGNRKGAILTGFFGGLVSSTAVTVSLARSSAEAPPENRGKETLTYLAATLAMLFEGVVLLLLGTTEIHASILLIPAGPIVLTVVLIVLLMRKLPHRAVEAEPVEIEILPIIKLAAFIIAILAVSKLLQNVFGRNGLLVLTFLVSLFEIHGSVIANIQMHDSGAFSVKFLGGLIALSVAASYLSKLFLIRTIGRADLGRVVVKYTGLLFVALGLGFGVFWFWA